MTYPAGYNKKNADDSSITNDDNIHFNKTSNNNSSNPTTDKNNNKRNNITNYNEKDANNNDNDDSNITIKRSTFTKLAIIGVAALMVSSFFAGYTLHQGIAPPSSTPTYVTLPTSTPSAIAPTANNTMPPTTAPPTPAQPTTIASVSLDDDPVRGNKDASITLVEFSDYQCPFCKRSFEEIIPEIKQKYIDTGKVKHVFRDYPIPINHQNAIPAAIAAECADEQGKFWEYHDILFTKQTEWQNLSGNATSDKFKEYAAKNLTQIDTNKFNSCIDSQKYKDEVDKDISDGSTYGVSGTPTFYIGNDEKGYTQIVGAQPVVSFESAINKIDSGSSTSNSTNTNTTASNNSTNT